VIEIDAASHGGVDDARDLRERAFYAPVSGRFKIYIIDEAHMVTGGGFNALLKLVEEPPPHLKFVFATTEPDKVIPTIRSRTHHYPFRLVPPAVLREHLEQILAAEGVPYEPAVLPVVIRAGAGSVRDALSVLDQLMAGSDESGLRYDRAIALLGYSDDRLLDEVIEAFTAADGAAVFHAIDHVVEAGHDPRRFAADLLDRLRDLIVMSAVPDAASTGLIDIPADRVEQLTAQAAGFGQAPLTRAAEIISAGLVEMRGATSPRLLLELMCAQVLLPGGSDTTSLAERLDRLERELRAEPQADRLPPTADIREPARPASRAAEAVQSRARPSAPAPEPSRPSPAPKPPQPSAPRSEAPPADADEIRARWPDILAAVQSKKKVAWIQLSNASVESYADGVLTLAFAQAGFARGFQTGGYDQDLSAVLTAMFGKAPQIKTTLLTGGVQAGGSRADIQPDSAPSAQSPHHQDERRAAQPADDRAGEPRAADLPRQAAAARPRGRARPAAIDNEPEPTDLPAPDMLTGTDLIERELGGRIIQELDGS
jgi:DNA polymerase-3 subunit gamma/tau